MITINGIKYKVVEDLGFSHDRNQYAKVVLANNLERVVVKAPYRGASWEFSKPKIGRASRATGQSEKI